MNRTTLLFASGSYLHVDESLSDVIQLWKDAVIARDGGALDVLLDLHEQGRPRVIQTAHIERMQPYE